jgi:aspartyl aminopeptidase
VQSVRSRPLTRARPSTHALPAQLKEEDSWMEKGTLRKGGRYFFTRAASTLVAFAVGGAFEPGNGFKVVGAHTDSPVLKIKPVSKKSASGYQQLGVECYGGCAH